MSVKIINAEVFLDGQFREGGIVFSDLIEKAGPDVTAQSGEEALNAEGMYLIPGLIDIHTHAAMGADASDGDPAGMTVLSRYYAKEGVTSWCPTTMTILRDDLLRAMETIREFRRPEDGAKVAGINMEGPFLSPAKSGAQNPAALHLPDAEFFRELQEASGGLVRMVSVAPELEGSMDFIREVSKEVTVSLAHTCADYETAAAAYRAGASHLTHTFNCMPPVAHRAPGPIPAALESGATAELITDGFHIHPSVIRMAFRMFGEKLVLISDSLRCAGMPDGDYMLGGLEITMKAGKATLKNSETLAGSSIHLMEGVRRCVRFGIPLEQAVAAATEAPARAIRMEDQIGSLKPGHAADLVLLDRDLEVKGVWIGGKRIR